MRNAFSRRQFLLAGMVGSICSASGCGTILYPDRRGQSGGKLDCGVVLLDGLGLLLFFIPGVIAFAVDFATGAIYLPEGDGPSLSAKREPRQFQTITLAPAELSHPQIAQVVSQHTGRDIQLKQGQYHTAQLQTLDQFWPAIDNLVAEHDAKPTAEVLRAQNP